MTREEAIKVIEEAIKLNPSLEKKQHPAIESMKVSLTALRGPTREMVERVFPGCPYCKPDSEGYVRKFGAYSIQNGELETGHCKPQKINFCPHCSRPLTDEAVDMMMRRWKEAFENA